MNDKRTIIICLTLLAAGLLLTCPEVYAENISRGPTTANHRGAYEICLTANDLGERNPWFDVDWTVEFRRPDGSVVRTSGFFDGDGQFKARAYCDAIGRWQWQSRSSLAALNGKKGTFDVIPSNLKGKLRIHPDDARQFAYDNGEWFLHIGDTGYRYVTASEPKWREYIDQAVQMGATKIRTWFCQGRSDVQILFTDDRQALNLPYWQEIDRRVTYALNHHPQVMLKLIPYGEDTQELLRYGTGDRVSQLVADYAQARFSALPNVFWCVSNDREIVAEGTELRGRRVPATIIDQIARDMAAREPWGTLLTNHQSRFSGYAFVEAPWSDIITLEDLDQVDGRVLLEYREAGRAPVVNDEDRYELYRFPKHPRYFFRRLMWASLLSGGHATYGGLMTYEPHDGDVRGVQGYYDAVAGGKLTGGAEDFGRIHKFFRDSGLTLVGMLPDDALVGNDPARFKCLHNGEAYLVYLANPDGSKPETDNKATSVPGVRIRLPSGSFQIRWYDPARGVWKDTGHTSGPDATLTAPDGGDWVLVLRRS